MERAVSRREPRRANERLSEARLQLAEFLLLSDSPAECARHAVSWLIEHTRVTYAMCMVLDANRTRLSGLAAEGFRSFDPASFTVDTDQSQHPLIVALGRTQPSIIRTSAHEGIDGLRLAHGMYLAFPLHGLDLEEDLRVGVLLAGPARPGTMVEGRWAAGLLGPHLTRLMARRTAEDGHRRFERERALL